MTPPSLSHVMNARTSARTCIQLYIYSSRLPARTIRMRVQPLLSPTHPLRLLTLTLGPSYLFSALLTLISDPIDSFSCTNRPFSNATSPTYHLHTFLSFLFFIPKRRICAFGGHLQVFFSILSVSNARILYAYFHILLLVLGAQKCI